MAATAWAGGEHGRFFVAECAPQNDDFKTNKDKSKDHLQQIK